MIVLSHPGWWLEHLDELTDALAAAERIREREAENARETGEDPERQSRRQWATLTP